MFRTPYWPLLEYGCISMQWQPCPPSTAIPNIIYCSEAFTFTATPKEMMRVSTLNPRCCYITLFVVAPYVRKHCLSYLTLSRSRWIRAAQFIIRLSCKVSKLPFLRKSHSCAQPLGLSFVHMQSIIKCMQENRLWHCYSSYCSSLSPDKTIKPTLPGLHWESLSSRWKSGII